MAKARSRRRFLKRGAVAVAGVTLAFPQISRAQTMTLKMQTSWGSGDIYQDMARQYVERVEAMSGGRLKINLFTGGAVVKSFQLQEAVHKGVLDGAHTVTAYWYGKHKAASLFGTGPVSDGSGGAGTLIAGGEDSRRNADPARAFADLEQDRHRVC